MVRFFSVATAMIFCGPALAQVGPAQPRVTTDEDYAKIQTLERFEGRLHSLGPKSVVVYVDDKPYRDRLRRAQAMRSAAERKAAIRTIESQYRTSMMGKSYEFSLTPDAALRRLYLPLEFDDKGYPILFSPTERDRLRGDGAKPGFAALREHFAPGMPVTVTLVRGSQLRPLASMVVLDNRPIR